MILVYKLSPYYADPERPDRDPPIQAPRELADGALLRLEPPG